MDLEDTPNNEPVFNTIKTRNCRLVDKEVIDLVCSANNNKRAKTGGVTYNKQIWSSVRKLTNQPARSYLPGVHLPVYDLLADIERRIKGG